MSLTLAQILGPWQPQAFESGLVARCRDAWDKPLESLSRLELVTFLEQNFAVDHVIPVAKKRLQDAVDDDSELFEGQLAEAVADAEKKRANHTSYQDQFFYVSNSEFGRLIEFGLAVGDKTAATDAEKSHVAALRTRRESFYPGCDFVIEGEFPTRDERKFWAKVFFDLAYLIFRREVGNQETTIWQYSSIGDSYLLARMIIRSVQEEELGWHPQTMSSLEADAYQKGLNVRL